MTCKISSNYKTKKDYFSNSIIGFEKSFFAGKKKYLYNQVPPHDICYKWFPEKRKKDYR